MSYDTRNRYGTCYATDCENTAALYNEETGRSYCRTHAPSYTVLADLEAAIPCSYAERAAAMRHSLMVSAVSDSDTLVILRDDPGRFRTLLKVAHIADGGWVDLFWCETMPDPADDVRRHVGITPSEWQTLSGAYAVTQSAMTPEPQAEPVTFKNCEKCHKLMIADIPSRLCRYCTRDAERTGSVAYRG